jgi:hypothetical protein
VCAPLDDPTALEVQDQIGVTHRSEAVGDHNAGGFQVSQVPLDGRLRGDVEAAGRLVEQQHGGR